MNNPSELLEQLDAAAGSVLRAGQGIGFATARMIRAQRSGSVQELEKGITFAQEARENINKALTLLSGLGAVQPGAPVARDTLPLDKLDTPATRALLEALEAAARAGAAVDRERGWIDDDGRAVGFGETLDGMAFRLRAEIQGPQGRD